MFLIFIRNSEIFADSFLKHVHIVLRRELLIGVAVILALDHHLLHHPNREQVKVLDTKPQLDTAEHEQGRCHFPLTFARFFLASTVVCTFSPHRSMSWGRI